MRRGGNGGGRLAGAAIVSLGWLLTAGVTARAQLPLPVCLPTSCPTPTPTPSAGATPTPTPRATPNPTAAASPRPGAGPPPPATQPGAPGGTAGPAAGPTPKPAPPGATPAPAAAAAAASLAILGVVDDPALAGQVGQILSHPAAADRPFLRHFLVGDPRHGGGPSGPRQSRIGAAGVIAWMLVAVVLLAVTAAAVAWRRRSRAGAPADTDPAGAGRSLLRRLVHPRALRTVVAGGALLGLALPVGLYIDLGVRAAGSVLNTPRITGSSAAVRRPAHAAAAAAGRDSAWTRLVAIERSLAAQHEALVEQERRVSALTAVIQRSATTPVPAPAAAAPAPAPPTAIAAPPPAAAVDLASVVSQHQETLTAYQQTLESEYQLYSAAAGDPALRAELLATANRLGPPEVASAVAFDLAVVQAQRSQDDAISAAEAQAAAQPVPTDVPGRAHAAGRPTLIAPLGGALTLGFGPTDLPFEAPATHDGVFYPHFHTGLDISAPIDTPVHAAADGRVILATASVDDQGRLVGYGNYVAIAHAGGLTTVYGHLDSISVKPGQVVRQGDVIGLEGSTGNSTGPHVHFETRLAGGIVDPTPYLARQVHLR